MRTTIKDIARYTGFSVTTISMVLNNKASAISENTKKIIFEAAETLNYRPNQMAVGLVKKQSKTLGLVISDVSNSFFALMAKGIEDECHKHGWNMILCNTNNYHDREIAYIQTLIDKSVDGIILCMARENTLPKVLEVIEIMRKNHLPFVMLDRFSPQVECSAVTVNHAAGGYLAGKYLLEMGHRKIGCITGPCDLADSNDRTEGVKKALKEFSVPEDSVCFYEGNYDMDGGEQGAEYLLKKGVTAIFAYNDLMAYGVYRYAGKIGKSIPHELSVVGYDDINFSEIITPPLTTVRQPVCDMGIVAVRQLIHDIQHEDNEPVKNKFEPELILRESVQRVAVQ